MDIFEKAESEVRSYCRLFPAVFDKAQGSYIYDKEGKAYLDFFCGAGVINYGHNDPVFIKALTDYLTSGGILHALDMSTVAKEKFLTAFQEKILAGRGLDYKVMFCAPTGTNGVEAALKLARKVTGRKGIFAFTGSFHGMTAGSMSVSSGLAAKENGKGNIPANVTFMPYPYGFNATFDTIEYIRSLLTDDHSGIEKPAAMILETVQAEGGVVVAPAEWLRRLKALCEEFGILLIVDDVQVGCYRTGNYFSFERAGIVPDMVVLSKALSGCGLPMSLLLIKPELDVWTPGEHNGTFRGNQLAFVTATAAIEKTESADFSGMIRTKAELIEKTIKEEILPISPILSCRGIGMIWGIDFETENAKICERVAKDCFASGLIIERAGRGRSVLKLLPTLTIEDSDLKKGLAIIKKAIEKNV